MKPIKLPYSVSNFNNLIEQGYYYVDKTPYIESLEKHPKKYFFYLRPRRFGKSLFISILQYYYGLEFKDKFQKLFGKYYIGQHPTPLANQYLVLLFEFTKIDTRTYESTFKGFLKIVQDGIERFGNSYQQFFTQQEIKNIIKGDFPAKLMSSLITLILKKTPNLKLYILVDEYDHFANELLAFRQSDFDEAVSKQGFVRKFYEAIKEGTHLDVVDRFFGTGVTPITLDSMTSGFNIATNLSSDLNRVELMGFTEQTVKQLFELSMPIQKKDIEKVLPILEEWYDGYKFNHEAENHLYNPNMVLYYLSHYQEYGRSPEEMLDTNIASDYHKVRRLIMIETPKANQKTLEKIILERTVRGRLNQQFSFAKKFRSNDFISLLFYHGFLTIDRKLSTWIFFKIPNYVIQKLYYDYFLELMEDRKHVNMQVEAMEDAVFEMAFKGNPHPFFDIIHNILHQLADKDYQRFDEKYVKIIMFTSLIHSEAYYVESERETPDGYLDLTLMSRPTVPVEHQYIFELKYVKKENEKQWKAKEEKAEKQLLDYIEASQRLKDLKNLQAWTVVVVKDDVKRKRIH